MKNYKLQVSEGFKDTFGEEMLLRNEIGNRIMNVFTSFGYETIKTPTLEYIDVYSNDGVQKPDLYSLINRQGEVLALCNDMTSSIARFVSSSKFLSRDERKFSYIADTFRYPRLYQGKTHEFTQAGIEIIGATGVDCDAECIYLAYRSLKACGAEKFTIHLGSSEFLHVLLDDFNVNKEIKKSIYEAVEDKDYVKLKNVLDNNLELNLAKFIFRIVTRGGRINYIEKLMEELKGKKSYLVLQYLKDLFLKLKTLHVDQVLFDFSIYSYAGYYTGIIFSVYIEGMSKAVILGGRCDDLYKSFGVEREDIGFGLDVDALTIYALENNLINVKKQRYLSFATEGNYINACIGNENFRGMGIIVSHSFLKTLEAAKAYAKENNFDKIISYDKNAFEILEVE